MDNLEFTTNKCHCVVRLGSQDRAPLQHLTKTQINTQQNLILTLVNLAKQDSIVARLSGAK